MEILDNLKKTGLTPSKIAEKTKIPAGRIYKWFQGVSNPKHGDIIILEKLLREYPGIHTKQVDLIKVIGEMQEEIIRLKASLIVAEPMIDYLWSQQYDKPVSLISGERRQAVTMESERLFSEWKSKRG